MKKIILFSATLGMLFTSLHADFNFADMFKDMKDAAITMTKDAVAATKETSRNDVLTHNQILAIETNKKYTVWNPPVVKKEPAASCKDGKCTDHANCFKKDGKIYRFFSLLRNKIEQNCKKI